MASVHPVPSTLRAPVAHAAAPREAAAETHLALACATIALGGVLLGLQVDGQGSWVGTGYASLGLGALVALVASLMQAARVRAIPRDGVAALSAAAGFAGLAFLVGGVLAPGGPWMFAEVALCFWILSRRRTRSAAAGPELSGGALLVLAAMLIFRLWITYQGSEHRWQVASVPVPGLSQLPFAFLEPIQRIELGSFRPEELGFPPTGLDFAATTVVWAIGFALVAAGLWWRAVAAVEHENDRIHATIHELPPALIVLVEKLLPEDEWQALGLQGLGERMRKKRIEALVRERLAASAEFHQALRSVSAAVAARALRDDPFAGEIQAALSAYRLLPPPEGAAREVLPEDDPA